MRVKQKQKMVHILICGICDFTCCSEQLLEKHEYEKPRKCEIESDSMINPYLESDLKCENCKLTNKTNDKLENI